jgi:Transcription initiation factor IID, 18kD subunit
MQKRERPDVTDVKFVIRKNRRQLNRVRYLLEMKAVITKATKVDAEEVAKAP